MKAILRNIRISPKKANLVAGLVRGATVNDALNQLKYTQKKAAQILYKVLASATANAVTNFKQDKDKLYIKEIIVCKGPTYKRSVSISKGRMHPILKRSSHITVFVDVQSPQVTSTPKPKATPQATPQAQPKEPTKKEESKPNTN